MARSAWQGIGSLENRVSFAWSVFRFFVTALLAVGVAACGAPSEPEPDEIEEGTAYAFDMYTHCGAREALFAGEYWEAVPVAHSPNSELANSPVEWDDPYQEGTMTRVSETSAVFEAKGRQKYFQLRPGATDFLQICS